MPRVPPGFGFGFCLASCGVVLFEVWGNYRGACAGIGDAIARMHCALCATWQEVPGMQFAISGCGGCLCAIFGSGLLGGIICGALTSGLVGVLCATYPQPVPPPPPYYPQPYPGPVPVPKPPYGPV